MPSKAESSSHFSADVIAALGLVVALLAGLLISYALVPEAMVNCYGPMCLLAVCGYGVYRLINRNTTLIWSPLTWFLLACTAYYGLGPLVYLYGAPETVTLVDAFYAMDEHALFRTNVLNAVSILSVCGACLAYLRLFAVTDRVTVQRFNTELAVKMLELCLLVGYGARATIFYLQWFHGREAVIPGVLFFASDMARIGLLITVVTYLNGERWCGKVALVLGGFELVSALTSLAKINVLELGVMVFLGVILARPSKKLIWAGGVVGVITYFLLVPFIDAGRKEYWVNGDKGGADSVVGMVNAYLKQSSHETVSDNQAWWCRLCYSNAQAFAMHAYDTEQPGDTFGSPSIRPFRASSGRISPLSRWAIRSTNW